MGVERDDTDPGEVGTDSDRGGPSDEGQPPPLVDFDALHAALGDPADFEQEVELEDDPGEAGVGESQGQAMAAYASAKPHAIPKAHTFAEDPNAPAVIVDVDDDAPPAVVKVHAPPRRSGPGHATVRLAGPLPGAGPISSNPQVAAAAPASSFEATGRSRSMTQHMPNRPVVPRRPRSMTVVMRKRGPTPKQKLAAFIAMLVLVTACGVAVVIWQRPSWVGIEPPPPASVWPPPPALPTTMPSGPTHEGPRPGATSLRIAPPVPVAPPLTASGAASAAPIPSALPLDGGAAVPAPSARRKPSPAGNLGF